MKIEFKQLTEDGPVSFSGEFDTEETAYLCEFALVELLKRGLIPMKMGKEEDRAKFGPGSDEVQ